MTPLPEWALRQLIAAASQCAVGPLSPDPLKLIDMPCALRQARRFKLDVSFALRCDGLQQPRLSVNDKGEPQAFRERLQLHSGALGLSEEVLMRFFALSPPAEVQTTIGVKWRADGGRPQRISLYLEELMDCPRAQTMMQQAATLALGPAATLPRLPEGSSPPSPAALCIDYVSGAPVAYKDYWMALERSDDPQLQLNEPLDAFRRAFPLCPQRGTRRYLLARRFATARGASLDAPQQGGASLNAPQQRGANVSRQRQDGANVQGPAELIGQKLLWMSEAHDREAAARAWAHVDAIRAELDIPATQTEAVLTRLRRVLGPSQELFLYPDLVCLDSDASGTAQGLLLYVSIR